VARCCSRDMRLPRGSMAFCRYVLVIPKVKEKSGLVGNPNMKKKKISKIE